jgi:hypothetical protein
LAVDRSRRVESVVVALDRRFAALRLGTILSVLALPLIFLLFGPKFSGTIYWLVAAMLYAFAKILEFYDSAIYSAGSILSGHTLKHFAAAAACGVILRYFQQRRPIEDNSPCSSR